MPQQDSNTPFPNVPRLIALLFLFVAAFAFFTNAAQPRQMDFISFWAAAKLAIAGMPAAAYDVETHRAVQLSVEQFDAEISFAYPPPFLFFVLPFGFLPFVLAAPVWTASTFALYLAAARRWAPHSGWLAAAFPPVIVNAVIGQNGFVTSGIFLAALATLPKRPFAAGLLFGCLVIKPQLAILVPLALLAARQWRAIGGAAASSLGLTCAALAAFGPDSFTAMARMLPLYSSIVADGLVGWHKMPSVYASLRMAGGPAELAWTMHGAVAAVAAAVTWMIWRSEAPDHAKAAVLATASVLISPYLFLYDHILLLLPFVWLVRQGARRSHMVLLWCVPMTGALQNWVLNDAVNLMPLFPIGLLALIVVRLRTQGLFAPSPGANELTLESRAGRALA